MTRKNQIKMTLILGLIVLSFGGWLLHFIIHSPIKASYGLVPFFSGLISVLLVPLLFWFRRTIPLAYILNGFTVILGTIIMAHFSIFHLKGPITIESLLFKTLLADIAILWGKFAIGKALFDLEFLRNDQDPAPQGRYFRYPNMGWWGVHLVSWTIVYALGVLLWK